MSQNNNNEDIDGQHDDQQQKKIERPKVLLASYTKPSGQTRNGPAPLASFEDLPTDDQCSPLEGDGRTPTNDPVVDFDELEFDVEPVKQKKMQFNQQLNVNVIDRTDSPSDTLTPVKTPTGSNDWPGSTSDVERKSSSVSQVTIKEVNEEDDDDDEGGHEKIVVRKKSSAQEKTPKDGSSRSRKSSLAGFLFRSSSKKECINDPSHKDKEKVRRKSSGILSFLSSGKELLSSSSSRKKSKDESTNIEAIHFKNHHFDETISSPTTDGPDDDGRSKAYGMVRKQINKPSPSQDVISPTAPGESEDKKLFPEERLKAYDVVREQIHVQTVRSRRESDWRPNRSASSSPFGERPPSVQEKLKSPSSEIKVIKEADDRADLLEKDVIEGQVVDTFDENDDHIKAYDQVRTRINESNDESTVPSDQEVCPGYPEERLRAYEHVRRFINKDLIEEQEATKEPQQQLETRPKHHQLVQSEVEVVFSDHDEAEDRAKAYGQVRDHINKDSEEDELIVVAEEEEVVGYPEDRSLAYDQVRTRINRYIEGDEKEVEVEKESSSSSSAPEEDSRSKAYDEVRRQMYKEDTVPGDIPTTTVDVKTPPEVVTPPEVAKDEKEVTSPDMMRELRLCKRKLKKRQDTTESDVSEVQSLPEILPSSRKPTIKTNLVNEEIINEVVNNLSDDEEEESSIADVTLPKDVTKDDVSSKDEKKRKKKSLLKPDDDDPEMASLLILAEDESFEDEDNQVNQITKNEVINSTIKSIQTSDSRRGSQVQILTKEERSYIKTLPLDRPRSLTPLTIAPLEEYLRRVSLSPDASGSNVPTGDRIKLSLPGASSTIKNKTPRKSNPQIWQDFCEKGLNLEPNKLINDDVNCSIKLSPEEPEIVIQNEDSRVISGNEGFLSVLSTTASGTSCTSPAPYDAFSPISDAPLTPITPLNEPFMMFDDTFNPKELKKKNLKKMTFKEEEDDDESLIVTTKECNKCLCFMRDKIDLLTSSPESGNDDVSSPLIEPNEEQLESQVLIGPTIRKDSINPAMIVTTTSIVTPEAEDVPLMSPNPCPCDCHTIVWRQVERSLSISKEHHHKQKGHRAIVDTSPSKDSIVSTCSSSSSSSSSGSYKCNESKSSQVKVSKD